MNQDNNIFVKDDTEKVVAKSQSEMKNMLGIKKEKMEVEDCVYSQSKEKILKKETTEKTDTKANLDLKNRKRVENCPILDK